MANRFEDLDAKQGEIDTALDDPDTTGTPAQFLATIERLYSEAHQIAMELTEEDFEAEYTIDAETEEEEEETEGAVIDI